MQFKLTPHVASVHDEHGEIICEAPSDAVAQAYFSGGSVELGLLPPAVRWVSTDGLGVIIERPPQAVNINYQEEFFRIFVPWTVWGIRFRLDRTVEKSYLLARPYPLGTVEDELFAFPLPNMGIDSSIALPSQPRKMIGDALPRIISLYWNRPFTGAYNEMLNDKTMVPDEWIPHLEEGVNKYLVSLTQHDVESITFSPLKVAQIPTMDALCTLLDPMLQDDGPQTTMQYFKSIVERAANMAGM